MANKSHKRCLLCGRLFEVDALAETALEEAFFEEIPKKSSSFCPLCEAKIKKEAKDAQEEPKPI